jgi:AcrR family transcriptional regulator
MITILLAFNQTHDLIARMNDTKEKIMDAAERLFGEYGYTAISLRHIISEAGVNLAAIHYHFGSKEDLLDQVILRKAEPINKRRIELLDRFESEASPEPASVEGILEAFIAPVIMIDKSPDFIKLMGRVHAEGLIPTIAQRHFQPIIDRFFAALKRALPGMSAEELDWKAHFALGAIAHTLTARPSTNLQAAHELPETIVKRLVSFITGGFRAPSALEREIEVNR